MKPDQRARSARQVRAVVAASIGNALEWFDSAIYGFFALTISRQFFPADDPGISLLIAFGTFGASFLFRPLGGLVIGAYADRAGRKAALLVTMMLMLVGTALIAFMPPYATIGVAAPVMVVIARIIQGFSAGGEFGSATAFLAEQTPERRAFYSSWQFASQGLTTLLAAGFGVTIEALLSPEQVQSWGWRVPFIFGLLIGPVALYIRRHVDESPEFTTAQPARHPLSEVIRFHKAALVRAFGAVILATVVTYVMVYMPTFAVRHLRLTPQDSFQATLVAGAIILLLTPAAGVAVDRLGRGKVTVPCALLLTLVTVPLFSWLTAAPTPQALMITQATIAVLAAGYFGGLPAFLTELFPVTNRSTGLSLSYNVSVMTFGGLAPFTITWLIANTGSLAAPSYYLAIASALSLLAVAAPRAAPKLTS